MIRIFLETSRPRLGVSFRRTVYLPRNTGVRWRQNTGKLPGVVAAYTPRTFPAIFLRVVLPMAESLAAAGMKTAAVLAAHPLAVQHKARWASASLARG